MSCTRAALLCARRPFPAPATLKRLLGSQAALARPPRHLRVVTSRWLSYSTSRTVAMGAGGSKTEGEEGNGKRGSRREQKETAVVATAAQGGAAAAGKEAEGAAGEAEYVECTVAKASEFGDNE